MRYVIMILAVLAGPAICHAATLKVPSQYPTIQDAINAASGGDTVLVGPGTYVENIDFIGKGITVTSEQGPDATVIDGGNPVNPDHGSTVSFKNNEGAGSVLEGFTLTGGSGTLKNAERYGGNIFCDGSSPTIQYNIIQACFVSYTQLGGGIACIHQASPAVLKNTIADNTAYAGAGIYCLDQASPTIADNRIVQNWSDTFIGDGGGICCTLNCNPTISGNVFSDNHASMGAAISIDSQSHSIIEDNLIHDNRAHWSASGIACYTQSTAMILNNRIVENDANSWAGEGGGIYSTSCTLIIVNNIIAKNIVAAVGGGIYCSESVMTVVNSTIQGNYGSEYTGKCGAGIHCNTNSTMEIANTILRDNISFLGGPSELYIGSSTDPSTVTIHHSNVKGGNVKPNVTYDPRCVLNWGPGMIKSDPLFVDASVGDLHLEFASPCKDTGDISVVTELHDFEGDPRIANGNVDMGADEFFTHLYWTGDATPGGTVEVKFVGLPGTAPVGLCLGSGVLDPPLPSMWGDWYLQFPIIGPMNLGAIPLPSGVLVFQGVVPQIPPPPYALPMQALIGAELTNLCVLEVK